GPRTVEAVKQAGHAGNAVQAGAVIVAEHEVVVRAADAAGILVVGVAADGGDP
ncbi:MAG: UDP-2,3-diacylglucosamine diphosphatase LpxI, partial [Rhizobiales bacterium]|nr:UDP-2,3-diacylglucosamine diphosphatase LpxI [Hyphomicrobiales bacterium]